MSPQEHAAAIMAHSLRLRVELLREIPEDRHDGATTRMALNRALVLASARATVDAATDRLRRTRGLARTRAVCARLEALSSLECAVRDLVHVLALFPTMREDT